MKQSIFKVQAVSLITGKKETFTVIDALQKDAMKKAKKQIDLLFGSERVEYTVVKLK